jgi:hypothetical protein
MKKSVLLSATLLTLSSIGLVSALFKHQETGPMAPVEESVVNSANPLPDTSQHSAVVTTPSGPTANIQSKEFRAFLAVFPRKTLPFSVSREELMPLVQLKGLSYLVEEEIPPEGEPEKKPEQVAEENAQMEQLKKGWAKAEKIHPVIRRMVDESQIEYFSRIPDQYEPVALLENAVYYAAVFSLSEGFRGLYRQYFVATFDKSGNPVSDRLIGRIYPEDLVSFSIDRNLNVHCQEHTIYWVKDFKTHGTYNNNIASTEIGRSKYIDLKKQQSARERRKERSERIIFKAEISEQEVLSR